ncbi:hypothetical protein GCM10027093_21580 [Paraburkholderia jirisanensis]
MRARSVLTTMTVSTRLSKGEEEIMLKWALFFAVVAVIAGLLGFTGVAAGAAAIAKFLFIVFVILCVVFLVLGFVVTKKIVD